MARSNSYNFNLTRNGLVTAAFQLCNLYTSEDTISNADMNLGVLLLNTMIKDWEAEGIHLWKRRQGMVALQKGVYEYPLGSTGENSSPEYILTTITTAAVLGATTLTVASTTGMTVGDDIGIQLSDGSRQWSVITTINSATSLDIVDATESAIAEDSSVITYTTKINRPMRILRATVYNLENGAETKLAPISYDEYFDMPLKTTSGSPNNFYYDKVLDDGVLYVFPCPSDTNSIIKFTYNDSLMDMDNPNDDFDFPQVWFMTLLYNLTVELMYAHKMFAELSAFEQKATALKQKAKQWDGDEESLRISYNNRYK